MNQGSAASVVPPRSRRPLPFCGLVVSLHGTIDNGRARGRGPKERTLKFHLPSYVLGFATGAIAVGARDALRPVAVELGALSLQIARAGRAFVERQRESLEDLRADIEERFRTRLRKPRKETNGVASTDRTAFS